MFEKTLMQDFQEFIGARFERKEPEIDDIEKEFSSAAEKLIPKEIYFDVEKVVSWYSVHIQDYAYKRGFSDALQLLNYLKG